jgi:hypothetical protein
MPVSAPRLEDYSAPPQPRAVHRVHILSIGDDSALLNSRELVLQSGGHAVLSMSSSASLSKDLLQQFDVVVLCHTLKSRDEIVRSIRLLKPDLPILLIDEICCETARLNEIYVSPQPEIVLIAVKNVVNRHRPVS